MCANYRIGLKLQEFIKRLGVQPDFDWDFVATDVRPTDSVPGISRYEGKTELHAFRWGLIPYWATDLKVGVRMFNARSETLEDMAAFQDSFHHRRCILPMESFFEYDDTYRYRVERADGGVMGVAGLWAVNNKTGERIESCTVVTCEPNATIAKVHDRMPAILSDSDYDTWLDPSLENPVALTELLRAAPDAAISMVIDGERKGKKRETPSLFE